jgi:hypothetical protein
MSSRVIRLSLQGLERAASNSDNDFTFIANGIELHCTQFEASFISPRVGLLVQQDKTINSFFVESLSLSRMEGIEQNRIIEDFDSLRNGSRIVGSGSEMRGLCEFAAVLGNTELLKQLCDINEINTQNVCSRRRNGHCCDCCTVNVFQFVNFDRCPSITERNPHKLRITVRIGAKKCNYRQIERAPRPILEDCC